MNGILRKIVLKELKTKDNKKFKVVEFTCDVKINEKGDIRTMHGSYSEEYARKYFGYCKVKTKDLVGEEVSCVVSKKTYKSNDGEERVISYIKFLNVLDENKKPIVMPKEETQPLDF